MKISVLHRADTFLRPVRATSYFYPLEETVDTNAITYAGRLNAWVSRRPDAVRTMLGSLSLFAKGIGANAFRFVSYSKDSSQGGYQFHFDVYHLSDSMIRVNQSVRPADKIFVFNAKDTAVVEINNTPHFFFPSTWYGVPVKENDTCRFVPEKGTSRMVTPNDIREGKRYLLHQLRSGMPVKFDPGLAIAAGIAGGLIGATIVHVGKQPEIGMLLMDEQRAHILKKIYKEIPEDKIRMDPRKGGDKK